MAEKLEGREELISLERRKCEREEKRKKIEQKVRKRKGEKKKGFIIIGRKDGKKR